MPGGLRMSTAASSLEKAASEAAGAPIRTAWLPDPAQLELMRGADGKLPDGAIHQVRTAGRPRGARNKRNKKIADFYVARFGDPLVAIGQLANTPLRQLVEVLREADNAAEREEMLIGLVRTIEADVAEMCGRGNLNAGQMRQLVQVVDKLADVAKVLRATPGKLALDALIVQMSAHKTALEYVHGKQPVSVEHSGKVDLVAFVPEVLRDHGIDADELQRRIASEGLEAFDTDSMTLLPPPEDGEFEDVEEEDEG
jgi:hypothetical protein